MHPLLVFSAGLIAGLSAVRVLKNDTTRSATASGREKIRSGLDTAQERLREAAVVGLTAVEKSSARLRTRLTPAPETPEPPPTPATDPADRPPPAAAPSAETAPKPSGDNDTEW